MLFCKTIFFLKHKSNVFLSKNIKNQAIASLSLILKGLKKVHQSAKYVNHLMFIGLLKKQAFESIREKYPEDQVGRLGLPFIDFSGLKFWVEFIQVWIV